MKEPDNIIQFNVNNLDLTNGINNIVSSLHQKFPNMNEIELQGMGNAYLQQIARHIDMGEQTGLIKQNPDGTFGVTILYFGDNG